MFDYTCRTVLVAGASSGIGAGFARTVAGGTALPVTLDIDLART